MGSLQAQEMADRLNLKTSIQWHLQHNHFPPIPSYMADVAIAAIAAARDDDYGKIIETPVDHRRYGKKVPAHVIIAGFHLESWLD